MIRSRTRLDTPSSQHTPKAYLALAIRYALFGAASLPLMMPTQAQSATDHMSVAQLPDSEAPTADSETLTADVSADANAFDGFDFAAIDAQSQTNQAQPASTAMDDFVAQGQSEAAVSDDQSALGCDLRHYIGDRSADKTR